MNAYHALELDVATLTLNPAIDITVSASDVTRGAVNRAKPVSEQAGGKGVNVACALGEQGYRVVALGFLGAHNQEIFRKHFARYGVRDRCIRLPGATRLGLKIVDTARDETTDLNLPGLEPGERALRSLKGQLERPGFAWCVLAGSLPPGVPTDYYQKAITSLRESGVRVGLDTSGEALEAAISAGPDFIKPNRDELAALMGRSLPDREAVLGAARELVARGVRRVVVSCGAEGAYFVSATECIHVRPPAIAVQSTVGAGDAMVAGLVAAELRGLSPTDSARLATAYACVALSRQAGKIAGSDARSLLACIWHDVEVSVI